MVSGDFGGMIRFEPAEVVRPGSAAEAAAAVRSAVARGLRVVPRGSGHSAYGQAQSTGGVLVALRSLRTIHDVRPGLAVVDAGATWEEVLAATLPAGLTPPVLTDHLDMTVGGTLAAGGVGGCSLRHGTQADQVLELDVVTPDGSLVTCSAGRHREVFDAVRGGLGRAGIIVRAALRLVPAPRSVLVCKAPYPDAAALLRAQRAVAADFVTGQAKPDRFELTAAVHDGSRRPDGLPAGETAELPYADFAGRMRPDVAELVALGEWARPHPWGIVFLPLRDAAAVIEETLARTPPELLGTSGVVLITPLTVRDVPALRVPADPVLFGLLRTASPGAAEPEAMLAANRELHARARRVGGTRYPIDAAP